MKNLTKISMAIIFIITNSLTIAIGADQVFEHIVYTDIGEISSVQTERGLKYSFEGDNYLEIEGSPEIPCKIITLALPRGTNVLSLESSGTDIINFADNVTIPWFEGDIKTDIFEQHVPAEINHDVYSSSNLVPGIYAELISSGYMGSQHLASIAVYPIQYRPADGEVLVIEEIELKVNLENSDQPISSTPNHGNGLFGPVPGDAIMGLGAEYLIVTSGELASAFYPFVVWKNQKGQLTEIVLIEDILASYSGVDDAEKLREYLKDAHNAGARWVLLGGDEDIVPIRYTYPGNVSTAPALRYQQICDVYFADLTGDWEVDGDGIWGEYGHDNPDPYPEVYVGRIPAESAEDVATWVEKAILYEQNPNNGDFSYLESGLFITADQMRDLNEHIALADLMPEHFLVDYSRLAEEPSGSSPNPTQPTGDRIAEVMGEGWGFISNMNHGGFYYYGAMTPGYNGTPRSDFFGDAYYDGNNGTSGLFLIEDHQKYGVHYSISCYNGAYDFDKEVFWPGPFITNNSFAEAFLFLPNKGGVAYLGNTRWGWVSSSFQLEKKFIEYVYSDTARQLAVAETMSKLYYPSKRDIGYGHTVFGDPEMSMWLYEPVPLTNNLPTDIKVDTASFVLEVTVGTEPAANKKVTVWKPGEFYLRGYTDENGEFEVPLSVNVPGEIYVTSIGVDNLPDIDTVQVHITLDADDTDETLPLKTSLGANYPNPFNANTEINFSLANSEQVSIEVFNITGQKVKTLVDDNLEAGTHSIAWNGANDSGDPVASGAYFYKLSTENESFVKKMVLLK